MLIGGLEKFSLLDFPEHISAIVFTQGCNFRCPFCYNPMLVEPRRNDKFKNKQRSHPITEDGFFAFLKSRQGKLDGVVITGGEPTIHADLPEFAQRIRDMGFAVKLDTNGTNPDMIQKLLAARLLGYIAMDLKGAEKNYHRAAGRNADLAQIQKSIKIIIESDLPHEFRTTLVPGLHSAGDVEAMAGMIRGGGKWYLQRFKSDIDLIDADLRGREAFGWPDMKKMKALAEKHVKNCQIR